MLGAMVLVGFPVAIGMAAIAHVGFHLSLDGRLAAAICFVASAVSTRVAAVAWQPGRPARDQRRQAKNSVP